LRCIECHKPAFTLYTDGSARDGTFSGGVAVVVTSGPAHSPTIVDIWKRRGSPLPSSFEEEKEAMSMALQRIISNEPKGKILICSDNQSLLKAIASESEETYEIRAKLLQVTVKTWTFSGFLDTWTYLAMKQLTRRPRKLPSVSGGSDGLTEKGNRRSSRAGVTGSRSELSEQTDTRHAD